MQEVMKNITTKKQTGLKGHTLLKGDIQMKKIAVVAANGRVAKKVIAEALNRGDEVVAFGRHAENDTAAKTTSGKTSWI